MERSFCMAIIFPSFSCFSGTGEDVMTFTSLVPRPPKGQHVALDATCPISSPLPNVCHPIQLQNLVALMDATTRKGESIFTMNLIPKRNIPVIPELARGPKVPRSRLQRDIEALLRP